MPAGLRRIGFASAVVAVALAGNAVGEGGGPPAFDDARQLPGLRSIEEEKAREAEAERRAAEEAERQRREAAAEAERREAAAEAERRAAEEAERQRREAAVEAERREAAVEAERRAAEEAERQRREAAAEAERREAAAEAERRAAEQEALSREKAEALSARIAGPACDPNAAPEIAALPQPGGRERISVRAPCHAGETITITYGPYAFTHPIDEKGHVEVPLDLFLGKDVDAAVVLKNGRRFPLTLSAPDLDQLSKIAIIWHGPVNLDLHALEYVARRGGDGHMWAGAPGSSEIALAATADGRGHGFMSSLADAAGEGDKVEVYTFWNNPTQASGVVALLVDYETRGNSPSGETCGSGSMAGMGFTLTRLVKGAGPHEERVSFEPAPCGMTLRDDERFSRYLIGELRPRR